MRIYATSRSSTQKMEKICPGLIKREVSESFGFYPGDILKGDFSGVFVGIYKGRLNGKGPIVKASIVQGRDGAYYRYCGGNVRMVGIGN